VRSQAESQADVVAASATDLLAPGMPRSSLKALVDSAATTVHGRVLVKVECDDRAVLDSAVRDRRLEVGV